MLTLDIAPLSHAFETFPAVSACTRLINHEEIHLHVVQEAIANDQDHDAGVGSLWARSPPDAVPNAVYSYLTVRAIRKPPRWYARTAGVL